MTTGMPFPTDPERTAMSIAYRNKSYIADAVLPRVTVYKRQFSYQVHSTAETFANPDTRVGRRGRVNQVDMSATEVTDSVDDYGIEFPIPQSDIDEGVANGHDPRDRATLSGTDYILIGREKRVADLVFAAGSYDASLVVTLSGTDKFSDYVNSSPISVIMTGLEAALMRPNKMVFGQSGWTTFAQHPAVVKAVNGNSGDSGIARRQQIAELFEVDEVLVGRSRLNTARKGQTPALNRIWGDDLALLYIDPMADTSGGVTFGMTAQLGTRVAGSIPDANIGLDGGEAVRTGERLKELIVADQAGYLIKDLT